MERIYKPVFNPFLNSIVFITIIILVCSIPFLAFAQQSEDMTRAISDAERDVNLADITTWQGVGCLFGIFGMIAASIIDPPVPAAKLLGESPEFRQIARICCILY